jgi:hypothetical protein
MERTDNVGDSTVLFWVLWEMEHWTSAPTNTCFTDAVRKRNLTILVAVSPKFGGVTVSYFLN